MDKWQTYPFEFKGGLISNLSPLQHGVKAPGSARILRNFEPSVEGGYRRINGYVKYSQQYIQPNGNPVVHGSGQSGTTLIVANLRTAPLPGDTFTVAGVTGTYTIAASGVSYDTETFRATLTLTTSLAFSPANAAVLTFANNSSLIRGLAAWNGNVIGVRGGAFWLGTGGNWMHISAPNYGVVLTEGGGQTGTSFNIDGLTRKPAVGDVFTINGVNLTYTILSVDSYVNGAATITISPALAASPVDNADLTFLGTDFGGDTSKVRFAKYRLGGNERILAVDSVNVPAVYRESGEFYKLNEINTDAHGATHVVWFKNQIIFAKDDKLIVTAPFSDDNTNPAAGAAIIVASSRITALIVFREQLIVFGETSIQRLLGNTSADFEMQPIADKIGCVAEDTVQEVAGDVMFLAADGLRLLGATDRIGDFQIDAASKDIQSEVTNFVETNTSFSSTIIRKKSQYRIFGYKDTVSPSSAAGILGCQVDNGLGSPFSWSELHGIKAYVFSDDYYLTGEISVFAYNTGYVYETESSNLFDGRTFEATFATPYVYINDPAIRKTFYRLKTYLNINGSFESDINLKLDFDDAGSIQPPTLSVGNSTGVVAFYGNANAVYGESTYGGRLKRVYETQTVGSGFFVSLVYQSFVDNPPYTFDAAILEYATHDRR